MILDPAPDLALVLTTWPADRDASVAAHALVDEELAACVNVLPAMYSTYRWEGATTVGREQQLIIKTRRDRVEALAARLALLHPYALPELVVLDVAGSSAAYAAWVRASTRG